jgi:hypothetical protein
MKKRKKFKLAVSLPLLLTVLVALIAGQALLRTGYFSMHDDVQVMRLFQMEKCLKDGQVPCRWVPDMGAGFGHPLYNYHPVFPYYLGALIRLTGISFLDTSKLLFFLTYLLSAIFMFILVKEFFGEWSGFAGASLFILAPYHSVEVYVRGALTESWAVAFFPLTFWAIYKLMKTSKFPFFLVSIFSLTFLFLSHNIMTMIFVPLVFVWGLYWILLERQWKKIFVLLGVFLWALGLAAFFILPAFLEKSLVKIETLTSDYYNFRNHFVSFRQLFFERKWGYGPSRPGPEDELSLQLGWPHWWLVVIAGLIFIVNLIKKRKIFPAVSFFFGLFALSAFMTHAKSNFIWEAFPLLSFVQFPWRFLAIAMFSSSFLAGSLLVNLEKPKYRLFLSIAIVFLAIVLNLGYFHPERYDFKMTDEKKLSGEEWRIQSMATLMDYIPKSVNQFPKELAPEEPWVVSGSSRISEFRKRSDFWRFTIESVGTGGSVVEVPVFDFPTWDVLIDQVKVEHGVDSKTGVIKIVVPPGKHTVVGWFRNTPLREAVNAISLASFGLLILAIVFQERRSEKSN